MARMQQVRHQGFDASPLLPLGVLVVAILMLFTPLSLQMMPLMMPPIPRPAISGSSSFVWGIPLIIIAALVLTSSEMLAPSNRQIKRVRYPYYAQSGMGSAYGNESPSWGLLGLMLVLLLMLPWQY